MEKREFSLSPFCSSQSKERNGGYECRKWYKTFNEHFWSLSFPFFLKKPQNNPRFLLLFWPNIINFLSFIHIFSHFSIVSLNIMWNTWNTNTFHISLQQSLSESLYHAVWVETRQKNSPQNSREFDFPCNYSHGFRFSHVRNDQGFTLNSSVV